MSFTSLKNRTVKTELDIKKEIYAHRCMAALKELDVPPNVLAEFSRMPLAFLFQFTHLSVNLEMPWREAFRWVNEHKFAILEHGEKLDVESSTPSIETNREADGDTLAAGSKE